MKRIIGLLIISCIIMPQLAFGGAWTLPKNSVWAEYYMKANWAKNDYSEDDLHRKNNDARSWGWAMIPKVEYGLTNWLTLLGNIEYKEAKYKEYARNPAWGPYSVKNHGFTAVTVGGRCRFLKDPVVLSGQIKGIIYTGYAQNDGDPDGRGEQPGLSDRSDSLEFRVLAGKLFNTKIPCYLGVETGYRFNNRGLNNDIPLFVEGGFWPTKWILIKSEIDGYFAYNPTDGDEKEYVFCRVGPAFSLTEIYNILKSLFSDGPSSFDGIGLDYITKNRTKKQLEVNLEFQYGHVIWGKNVSEDQEVIMKVSCQF